MEEVFLARDTTLERDVATAGLTARPQGDGSAPLHTWWFP
jgi:hypothetical protein